MEVPREPACKLLVHVLSARLSPSSSEQQRTCQVTVTPTRSQSTKARGGDSPEWDEVFSWTDVPTSSALVVEVLSVGSSVPVLRVSIKVKGILKKEGGLRDGWYPTTESSAKIRSPCAMRSSGRETPVSPPCRD